MVAVSKNKFFRNGRANKWFCKNRLTSEIECGIILINKDKHAIFRVSENQLFRQGGRGYGEKIYLRKVLFALVLMLLLPSMVQRQSKSKMENQ